jgi:hypothetical protein
VAHEIVAVVLLTYPDLLNPDPDILLNPDTDPGEASSRIELSSFFFVFGGQVSFWHGLNPDPDSQSGSGDPFESGSGSKTIKQFYI